MQYISTRGQMAPASYTEVLLNGLGPDGGLVMPAQIPLLSMLELEGLRSLSYPELASEIIGMFATDIPREDLDQLTRDAYGPEVFTDPDVVPLRRLDAHTGLVGLSQGPTMAFKDLAMQFLGQAVPYVLKREGRVLNILGATSGDTGSAAEYAFRGKPNISVFMLSPAGRMSDVQRAQMYSLKDKNIHNLAVDGVFDDCQNLVKEIMNDADFKAAYSLGAVNSINFGRISAQIVYYVWLWLRATDELTRDERPLFKVNVVVPSGNFGNIFAGHLARRMGVPIGKLVLATNENNVLEEFFNTGVYRPRSSQDTLATSSPSMDISKASNLERFVWELLGDEGFAQKWKKCETTGYLDLSSEHPRFAQEYGFLAAKSTHNDRLMSIREVHALSGIVVDPHTADGVTAVRVLRSSGVLPKDEMTFILETAQPTKFGRTVAEALGEDAPEMPEKIRQLLAQEQVTVNVPNDAGAVRSCIEKDALR